MKNNRINKLFREKKENILSIYFTAGYPNIDDTIEIILSLDKAGVDLIEIGIPFSDPLADGQVIQNSSQKAIENGMTLKLLLKQLEYIRTKTQIPIILMGYLNPILQYGEHEFCKKCFEIGVDGLIIPDLPLKYYQKNYQTLFEKNKLINIQLITPQTSSERMLEIDNQSNGFIYVVSNNSITGVNKPLEYQENYFNRINQLNFKTPTLIGFGIHDHESFLFASNYSNGAIIGSAFIKEISNSKNTSLDSKIKKFIQNIIS